MLYLRALRFLARLGSQGPVGRERLFPLGDRQVPCLELLPLGRARGRIITLHGMSPEAEQDPRWVQVNRGLCRAGFAVYSPRLKDVAALRIAPAQIDGIVALIAPLTAAAPAGLLSVSFSGALTLIAAARPALTGRISAVCTLGSPADVQDNIGFLLTDPGADPYGRLIVLGNFIEHAVGPRPALAAALLALAADDFHGRTVDRLAPLDADDRALAAALLSDPEARRTHWAAIQAARPPAIAAMSVVDNLAGISAAVTLVHGVHDRVIAPSQLRLLADRLAALQVRHRACLTPLISHGDTRTGLLPTLRHAPPLVAALAGFFADVERREP